jgi:flavin-binding protein dodecin
MANETGEGFPGKSRDGFSAAAKDAVRRAEEKEQLKPEDEGVITLVVTQLEVDVEGPIGEYRVVLEPKP